tara:strand:- start:418 stop:537 length:120 start_codon:yes stop_codon:yes gene_type:complete
MVEDQVHLLQDLVDQVVVVEAVVVVAVMPIQQHQHQCLM